jgi:hypothetical protein
VTYGDPQLTGIVGGIVTGWGGGGGPGSVYATNASITSTSISIKAGDLVMEEGQECLADRLDRIERCLGIVPRQTSLEEKYPDLKQLGDEIDQVIDEMQKSQAEMISRVVGAYKDFVKECEIMEKLSTDGNP